MDPNDIFNMAASIGRAQVASAQAAHDARQPEVDRLKARNEEMRAALRQIAAMALRNHNAPGLTDEQREAIGAIARDALKDKTRAAIANAERAGR